MDLFQIDQALPQQFEFYHLGGVELQSAHLEFSDLDIEDTNQIAFSIHGDLQLSLILFFGKELDVSTYTELGNVIASKIVNHLTENQNLDLVLSPPQVLAESQIQRILHSGAQMLCRRYAHFFENSVISIEAMILSAGTEGIGNA